MIVTVGYTSFSDNLEELFASKSLFRFLLAKNGLFELVKEGNYTMTIRRSENFSLPLNFDGRQEYDFNGKSIILSKNGIEIAINKFQYLPVWKFPFCEKHEPLFEYNLPLIPLELLLQANWTFRKIYKTIKSEVMLEIFYNKNTNEYELKCPLQKVRHDRLDYVSEEYPNLQKVMQIHSHNIYPTKFSKRDDGDEREFNTIYGIIGDMSLETTASKCAFRVFSKGKYKYVKLDSLFTSKIEKRKDEMVEKFNKDYLEWKKNITLLPTKKSYYA